MSTEHPESFSISDNLGKALLLYADNFRSFLNFSMAVTVPTILQELLRHSPDESVRFLGDILRVLFLLPGMFFSMAMVFFISSKARGESLLLAQVCAHVWQRFWRATGANFIFMLAVLGGTLLLILPGIYCVTVLFFFLFIILFEDKGVWDAFKRSDELVKGRFWEVLTANMSTFALLLGICLALNFGMEMMGASPRAAMVVVGVVMAVVMPLFIGFYYYLYGALKAEKDKGLRFTVKGAA